jgi:tetratricopeptide (TPR) repeat protein
MFTKGSIRAKFWALIFLGVTISVAGFAQAETDDLSKVSPERLFSRGNDYYEKGDYLKAIGEYGKIIVGGYESGPLYYNLANAYFKAGKLGRAVLNYERADFIMPRDGDLKANYKFANALVKEKPVPEKGIWGWRPVRIYSDNLTVNEITWLSSFLFMLILLSLVGSILRPNLGKRFFAAVIAGSLLIAFNILVIWKKADNIKTGAIVVVPQAEALFGPFDTATKFFALPEGAPVKVLAEKDDWCKVKRLDGNVGWVKKSEIERVMGDGNQG